MTDLSPTSDRQARHEGPAQTPTASGPPAAMAGQKADAQAVALAKDFGFSVLPLITGGKLPPKGYTFNRASNAPAVVQKLFSGALKERGDCNIAIMTGEELRDYPGFALVVVDVDNKGGGVEANYRAMTAKYGDLPFTVMVRTPSGGAHFYLLVREDVFIPGTQSKLADYVDVRGNHGLVGAPGSSTDKGSYRWARNRSPAETEIAVLPEAYLEAMTAKRPRAAIGASGELKIIGEADTPATIERAEKVAAEWPVAIEGAGGRETTHKLAHALMDIGCRPETAAVIMEEQWDHKNVPPWSTPGNPEGSLREVLSLLPSRRGAIGCKAIENVFEVVKIDASAQAEGEVWPTPTPLPDRLLPVPAFDIAFLPATLTPCVEDIAERMQCPPDYIAISALVAVGSVIGRQAAIYPQRETDWSEVPNLWGCIVGDPGSKKSPAMGEALEPLRELESEARLALKPEVAAHEQRTREYRLRKDALEKKFQRDVSAGLIDVRLSLPEEPIAPRARRFKVDDATHEALGEILVDNPNGVLSYRDEIISLLKHLDREENVTARGFYLSAWTGKGSYDFDRIGRGHRRIDAACLSLLGSTQPGRLAEYMRRSLREGGNDGMVQRFGLLVWPDRPSEFKSVDRPPDNEAREVVRQTFRRLAAHRDRGAGTDNAPIAFRFCEGAQVQFSAWLADLELRLRSDELSPYLAEHLSKYRGLVPALANQSPSALTQTDGSA
jgi:Protein of unknown function (DUF3987)/Bifunctional DNA primase/polymerase, N-terminal